MENNLPDPLYKDEIVSAINTLEDTAKPIAIKDIVKQLTRLIANTYDNSPVSMYKSTWNRRIKDTLNILKLPYNDKKKQDWESILEIIIDNSNGFRQDTNNNSTEESCLHEESSTAGHSYKSGSFTSSSSTTNIKQQHLSSADYEKIESMYSKIDNEKKWTLSSGTIVEDQMKQFALKCIVEHPSHSLILDTADKCWETVFDEKDLGEIKTYKLKQLPPLPSNMQEYLDSLKPITGLDLLYTRLKQQEFHPLKDTQLEWIQSTLYNCVKLFMFNYLPLTDQSESDLLKRLWYFIDTAFDDSRVNCRSGEKSSLASSTSRNLGRTIGGTNLIQRKFCGRKLDMVFKRNSDEYGLTECSRYHQSNDTKQLMDGGFKMPKILKDMFVNLANSCPDKVRDIETVGYQLMETTFILSIMDSPAGVVCRINHLYPLKFPDDPDLITKQLIQILEVVYSSRLVIERTRLITLDRVVGFDLGEDGPIPPCYHVQPKPKKPEEKKRKLKA